MQYIVPASRTCHLVVRLDGCCPGFFAESDLADGKDGSVAYRWRETELLGWVIWHDGNRYVGENAFPMPAVIELASTRLLRVKNAIRAIHAQLDGAPTPSWYARWLAAPVPARIDLDALRDSELDKEAEPKGLRLSGRTT